VLSPETEPHAHFAPTLRSPRRLFYINRDTARVADQIRSLGAHLIIVLSGSITSGGVRLGSGSHLTITEDHTRAIQREVSSVQVAVPTMRGGVQVFFLGTPTGRRPCRA
jgi:hypothetical protein